MHYIVYIPYQIITTTFNTYQCLANNTGPNNTKRGGTYYTTLNHILQNNEPQKIGLLCTQHTLCIVPQNIDLQITMCIQTMCIQTTPNQTNKHCTLKSNGQKILCNKFMKNTTILQSTEPSDSKPENI